MSSIDWLTDDQYKPGKEKYNNMKKKKKKKIVKKKKKKIVKKKKKRQLGCGIRTVCFL